MTGLRVIGRSICPKRFRLAEPRVSNDRGAAEVSGNSWGGGPESITRGTCHYLFYYTIMLLKEKNIILIGSLLVLPWVWSQKTHTFFNWKLISSTMGLVTKKHICLNDRKLFLRIIIMKNNINSN